MPVFLQSAPAQEEPPAQTPAAPGLVDSARPPLEMFFAEEDLPAMREKAKSGRSREFLDMMSVVLKLLQTVSTEPLATDGDYIGRNLMVYVGIPALLGLINENPDDLALAKRFLLAAADQYTLKDYTHNTHLSAGDAAIALAIGYDWVGQTLTPEEREKVLGRLNELGEYLMDSSANPNPPSHAYKPHHNHSAVVHCGLLLAGHVLNRKDWVDYATPWMEKYMRLCQDGTGAPFEGLGYIDYGGSVAALATEFLRRQAGRDLLAESPGYAEIDNYLLHQMVPWRGSIIPLNQTGANLGGLASLYYVLNRKTDGRALGNWQSILGSDGIAGLAKPAHTSHMMMFPFLFLWTDNAIEPTDSAATNPPLSAKWDRGMIAARTSWSDPNAALITFQSGSQPLGSWDHPDENSYTFTAWGDNFLLDPGAHIYMPDSHNIVIIDGQGMTFRGPGQRTLGKLETFEGRGSSVYVVGDAAKAYTLDSFEKPMPGTPPVQRAERRVLFVRASHPFAVVADKITMTDGQPHDWTLRTVFSSADSPNTAEITAPDKAVITGARSGGQAVFQVLEPADVKLSLSNTRGQKGKSSKNIDAAAPRAETGRFLTIVTAAPANSASAQVEKTAGSLQVKLPNGDVWDVLVSESDLSAKKQEPPAAAKGAGGIGSSGHRGQSVHACNCTYARTDPNGANLSGIWGGSRPGCLLVGRTAGGRPAPRRLS